MLFWNFGGAVGVSYFVCLSVIFSLGVGFYFFGGRCWGRVRVGEWWVNVGFFSFFGIRFKVIWWRIWSKGFGVLVRDLGSSFFIRCFVFRILVYSGIERTRSFGSVRSLFSLWKDAWAFEFFVGSGSCFVFFVSEWVFELVFLDGFFGGFRIRKIYKLYVGKGGGFSRLLYLVFE